MQVNLQEIYGKIMGDQSDEMSPTRDGTSSTAVDSLWDTSVYNIVYACLCLADLVWDGQLC